MPTGTLANHMAVRALAGGPSRVIVQDESHFYQDEGDCAQTLSNLTLVPLAAGRATFTADEVQQVLDQTHGRARVIACRSSPSRRRCAASRARPSTPRRCRRSSRSRGARHPAAPRWRAPVPAGRLHRRVRRRTTRQPFDTVYVSLYKYFNAASGAILAGPRELLDGMYHGRRMFGGGLPSAWPFAVVALHYLTGFADSLRKAVRITEETDRGPRPARRLRRRAHPVGHQPVPAPRERERRRRQAFRKRLAAQGVMLPRPAARLVS